MKKYSQYIDSGVEWLGKIPCHWKVKRLRAALTERRERYSSSESLMILSLIKDKGIIPYDEKGEVGNKSKDDHTQYKVARKGDLVINSMNVIIGSLGITPYDGYISPAYYSFMPSDEVNLTYYNYVLSLRKVQQSIRCFSKGIMEIRLKISAYDFLSMPFPFPTLNEQEAIANYLDTVTTKIDEAITQQQKMIDLLNERKQIIINNTVTKGLNPDVSMKHCGIDWIAEIPEHWEIKRGKFLFDIINEYSSTGEEELLTVSDRTGITPRSMKNVNMFMAESLVGYKKCKIGDICSNIMWMWHGAVGVTKYDGVISPSYGVYRQKKLYYNGDYLDMLLRLPQLVKFYGSRSTGLTESRLRLYPDDFMNIYFFVPPIEEQEMIVKRLKTICEPIESAIDAATQQIYLLQERKQIIVNDVVTGKVKVS